MTQRFDSAVAAAGASVLACVAAADVVTLGTVADATLIEEPTAEYALGAAYNVYAGRIGPNGGSTIRRAMLRFDCSSLPARSTITSVSLKLYMSQTQSGSQTVEMHKGLLSWTEGSAFAFGGGGAPAGTGDSTWNYQSFPSVPWPTRGGVFSSVSSASRAVAAVGSYTWSSTAQLVNDVQGWLADPATNHGWVLIGNEAVANTVKRFDTREASANRPALTIVFTPPPTRPADFNNSGAVDGLDLAVLLAAWEAGTAGVADLTDDGTVNGQDLALVLADWG